LIQVFLNGDMDAKLVSCIPGFSFRDTFHDNILSTILSNTNIKDKMISMFYIIILYLLMEKPGHYLSYKLNIWWNTNKKFILWNYLFVTHGVLVY
jgi:hypothetical protein